MFNKKMNWLFPIQMAKMVPSVNIPDFYLIYVYYFYTWSKWFIVQAPLLIILSHTFFNKGMIVIVSVLLKIKYNESIKIVFSGDHLKFIISG